MAGKSLSPLVGKEPVLVCGLRGDAVFSDIELEELTGLAAAQLNGMPVVFEANLVENNHSLYNYPGVTCVNTPECSVLRNTFRENYSEKYGTTLLNPGALYVKASESSEVVNNFFVRNTGYHAGAAYLTACVEPVRVINNTFAYNTTLAAGSGTVRTETDADFVNNIFLGDVTGIRVASTTTPVVVTILHNDFYEQSLSLTANPNHSTVDSLNQESFAYGNIGEAPRLVNEGSPDLLKRSPCIDAGMSVGAPGVDFYGKPRPRGKGYDMGAYESTAFPLSSIFLLLLN